MPAPALILKKLDLLLLRFDLGLCNAELLLCRLKLGRNLAKLSLELSSPLGIRIAVATQSRIAFAEDGHLVDLLRKLAMLSLRGGSLNSAFPFLDTREHHHNTTRRNQKLTSDKALRVSSRF